MADRRATPAIFSAPADKIYYATMEEGFYEVDVHTLAIKELYEDGNRMLARKATPDIAGPLLPGYHGKGLYSGQGRLVYSNNGEYRGEQQPPSIPSGCLAQWDGQSGPSSAAISSLKSRARVT